MSPVTVAVPFVQPVNSYVYCSVDCFGVAVTSVPFTVKTFSFTNSVVPTGTYVISVTSILP